MNIPLHQLLSYAHRPTFRAAVASRAWDINKIPYTDTTGFHLYGDLDMELRLTAGDDHAAALTLQILQAYAFAADAICEPNWLRILEVQGGRIHLYVESAVPNEQLVRKLIRSCEVFHHIATREISKLAGKTSFSIRMAADHGRAILLRSNGEDVSESIVSLGNPANRPAKHLAREVRRNGVPAGHLALNVRAIDPDAGEEWVHIDLRSERVAKTANESADLNLLAANDRFSQITAFAEAEFEPNPGNPVFAPIRRRGFMLRADLDGHTHRVKDAMSKGKEAIARLVRDFNEIMKYPSAFKNTLPKGVTVLLFPWAGDCANLFLECDNYPLEQIYLPNTAAINWHTPVSNGTNWNTLFEKTRWLVAIAGGDEDDDHGCVLTGNVRADGRIFHVGAGWSWQRSLDAEQAAGNKAGDSVIQNEDYAALDAHLQEPYIDHPEHPTLFKVASVETLVGARSFQAAAAKVTVAASVPRLNIQVPAPRPYGGY